MLRSSPTFNMMMMSGSASSSPSSSALFRATPICLLYSKKTARRPIRSQHNASWYKKAKGNYLTAKTIDELRIKPSFPNFQEEVDKPFVLPPKEQCICFQCKSEVDTELRDKESYIWIPSGAAKYPTPAGYFFHTRCFRCEQCGFRFHHNKFYSQDDKAVCVSCALGRQVKYPYRWWHGNESLNSRGRVASRMTGHQWPRHQHQVEFLNDPDS